MIRDPRDTKYGHVIVTMVTFVLTVLILYINNQIVGWSMTRHVGGRYTFIIRAVFN